MNITPANLLLIILMTFVCCLCSLVCLNELNNLNYTSNNSEMPDEDLVVDLSGVYIRSEHIRDTINPLFNDSFIDLSQNSDSVV